VEGGRNGLEYPRKGKQEPERKGVASENVRRRKMTISVGQKAFLEVLPKKKTGKKGHRIGNLRKEGMPSRRQRREEEGDTRISSPPVISLSGSFEETHWSRKKGPRSANWRESEAISGGGRTNARESKGGDTKGRSQGSPPSCSRYLIDKVWAGRGKKDQGRKRGRERSGDRRLERKTRPLLMCLLWDCNRGR